MKRYVMTLVLILCLCWTFAYAAQSTITGSDYIKMSKRQRARIVTMYEEEARKQGVIIRKEPVFYCKGLDAFYEKNPGMKKEPVTKVLKTLIIMEYDWQQKGVDKEKLAREWLGEEAYRQNKARLR